MLKLKKKTIDGIFIIEMLALPVLHFLLFWLYVNFSSITLAFKDEWTGAFTFRHFERFLLIGKRILAQMVH